MNWNRICTLSASLYAVLRTAIAALFWAGLLATAKGDVPGWWRTRAVIVSELIADDYAVANVGQLKHFAKAAALEMDARLDGGAGADIEALLNTWAAPNPERDDFAGLTVGQLKSVSVKFYERLAPVNEGSLQLPWGGAASDDFALANVGQLKMVFSFPISSDPFDRTDTARDWRQAEWDADFDGVSDAVEAAQQTNSQRPDHPLVQLRILDVQIY